MSTPTIFPNPEREWEREAHLTTLERSEVERRIGPTQAPLELLSGGQANINVRVGADRLLRIYRRDPEAHAKEHWLLQRAWQSFVTPAIHEAGDDFLVLDYVAHGFLLATPEHGAAVGRALAEIHRTRFAAAGLFTVSPGARVPEPESPLDVSPPFGDFADAFREHARSELERATWLDSGLRSAVDDLLVANADELRREAASPVLLHGDFKASNLHWTSDNRLLVLDWEFAYAGPALMDIGQLLRWTPPAPFVDAFADSYSTHGGSFSPDWRRLAEIFDLVNLAGLAAHASAGSPRERDLHRRIESSVDGSSERRP